MQHQQSPPEDPFQQDWQSALHQYLNGSPQKGKALLRTYFQKLSDQGLSEALFQERARGAISFAEQMASKKPQSYSLQLLVTCSAMIKKSAQRRMLRSSVIDLEFASYQYYKYPEDQISAMDRTLKFLRNSTYEQRKSLHLNRMKMGLLLDLEKFESAENLARTDIAMLMDSIVSLQESVIDILGEVEDRDEELLKKLNCQIFFNKIDLFHLYSQLATIYSATDRNDEEDNSKNQAFLIFQKLDASISKESDRLASLQKEEEKEKEGSDDSLDEELDMEEDPQLELVKEAFHEIEEYYAEKQEEAFQLEQLQQEESSASQRERLGRGGSIPASFNLEESTNRLYKGESNKVSGYGYDNVPTGFYIRENPYVREKLFQGQGIDKSVERLYSGKHNFDADLEVHQQPFINYSRTGFMQRENLIYENPKALVKSSLKNQPNKYYIAQEGISQADVTYHPNIKKQVQGSRSGHSQTHYFRQKI